MDNNCAICLQSLQKNVDKWMRLHLGKAVSKKKKKIKTLECFHSFHQKCLKEWFKRSTSCPLCRQ